MHSTHRRLAIAAFSAVAALTALTACSSSSEPTATTSDTTTSDAVAADDMPVIGLVMKSLGAEFFQNMQAGAEAHATERGDLELISVGTQSQSELDQQIAMVEDLIAQNVDAIVIAPMDSQALVAPLARAVSEGIVVINIDVALDADALDAAGVSIPFVGPDNRAAAELVGDALAGTLDAGDGIVIIEGISGADNAQQRKFGFEDSIATASLELLSSNTANWETDEANQVFSDLLTRFPDMNGVMVANDAMALGVAQALTAAGRNGEIGLVGFDNDPAIAPFICDGTVLATVEQFGASMAAFGIDFAMDAIGGTPLEGWVKTDTKLITADDLDCA